MNPTIAARHAKRILDSHLIVGREKPVSYLPIQTVQKILGITAPVYRSMIERLGNQCCIFAANECRIKSGAVYAYNRSILDELLKDHEETLSKHGWPTASADFIRRVASEWLEVDHPVMPVVRKVFGETDCLELKGR